MIKDRPAHLVAQNDYGRFPTTPFSVRFDALPELLRTSLGPLGGIQPVTGAMAHASNGPLHDMPSEGEVKLFEKLGTKFQLISLVMNIAHLKTNADVPEAIPYSLTLIPASKRGIVDERSIGAIAKLNIEKIAQEMEPCYAGLDPFCGEWSLFAPLAVLMHEGRYGGHLDELGLVVAQYFLATTHDSTDVLETLFGFADPSAEEKFRRHRAKLLYAPFGKVASRRLWGAESPIELFLFQELLRRGARPSLQILICDDGSIHPSLHHLRRDVEFRHLPGIVTESDMYFPEARIALFCDSNRHHRGGRAKAKDKRIDERLQGLGIKPVRVPGRMIVSDLKAAADIVSAALRA